MSYLHDKQRAGKCTFFPLETPSANVLLLSRSLSKQKRWDLDFMDVEKNSYIRCPSTYQPCGICSEHGRAHSQRFIK
jgi:hypothetical protein